MLDLLVYRKYYIPFANIAYQSQIVHTRCIKARIHQESHTFPFQGSQSGLQLALVVGMHCLGVHPLCREEGTWNSYHHVHEAEQHGYWSVGEARHNGGQEYQAVNHTFRPVVL